MPNLHAFPFGMRAVLREGISDVLPSNLASLMALKDGFGWEIQCHPTIQ
jgi:hypothetical protein